MERGEEVVIARAGQPVATLCRYRPLRRRIAPPGSMGGADWWLADDFDEPIDDLFDCLRGDAGPGRCADAMPEPLPPAEGPPSSKTRLTGCWSRNRWPSR